jgi:hypothetical protein
MQVGRQPFCPVAGVLNRRKPAPGQRVFSRYGQYALLFSFSASLKVA